jgi:glycosyltransferase involved in cell wall biosynthesis
VTTRSGRSVVHVLWSAGIGGVERLVVDLAAAQRDQGEDVRIAFAQAEGQSAERAKNHGVPVVDLGLRSGFDLRPAGLRQAARALGQSDVVHLHGFNVPFGIATTRSRKPIVYTEHGFTAHRRADLIAAVKLRLKRRFLRKRVSAVAANSRFTADRAAQAFGIPRSAFDVVHNGIDVSRVAAPGGDDRRHRITLACVSRLVAWKRIDLAIAALAASGRTDMRLVVLGDGPERRNLERQSRDLRVADQVAFLGWQDDVDPMLSAADVLVHPSRDEWFGLVVLEATALGLRPIVLSDAGGALEILPPDGIVVQDATSLEAALRDLSVAPSLTPEARQARSEWVRRSFPIARTAELYSQLYEKACS